MLFSKVNLAVKLRLFAIGLITVASVPVCALQKLGRMPFLWRVNLGPWTAVHLNASRGLFKDFSVVEVDFGASDFSSSTWRGVRVAKSNFDRAQLSGTWFTDCSLKKVSFYRAKMSGVHFSQSRLEGTSFREAGLTGAYFDASNCRRCDFRGADLRDATFALTELTGALFDANTKLPFSSGTAIRRSMIFVH